ncbi:transposase [Streptomyces decoyicus]
MSDDLWDRVEPLLPVRQQRLRRLGRPPRDDRGCLQGIRFVLHMGIQWERLPQELGPGSGMTCWRRLRDWHEAGCGTGCTRRCSPSCAVPGNGTGGR